MSDSDQGPIKVVPRCQNMNFVDGNTLNIVLYLLFRYGYHNDTC